MVESKKVNRLDRWQNHVTGLGTERDKNYYNTFGLHLNSYLTPSELDDLYHYDDICSLICDVYPEESFKNGLNIKNEDVKKSFIRLKVVKKVTDALVWSRVFGGSALFINADDSDDLSIPINPYNISEIKELTVLDLREINPYEYDEYGNIKTYTIGGAKKVLSTGSINIVHTSRLLLFYGARTSNYKKLQFNGWGQSFIQRAYNTIESFGIGFGTLSHLIVDANQAVYGMKDYISSIEQGDLDIIQARLTGMDRSRSVVRALVMDSEENFTRYNFSWSGMEKPFELLMMRLSSAVKIPVTILMGRSPAGENATGDSDFRGFYGHVAAYQEQEILPQLIYLGELIAKGELFAIAFPPLWEPTLAEKAVIRKDVATADAMYFDRSILTGEEISKSRFTEDGWQFETYADIEMRERLEQVELKVKEKENDIDLSISKNGDVAKEALNGIQMKELKTFLQEYKSESNVLSPLQARAWLKVAFPSLDDLEINQLIS